MAEPLLVAAPTIVQAGEVYGRIVGVNAFETGNTVRIALADGGRRDYATEEHVAEAAARLFNRTVRGEYTSRWSEERGEYEDKLGDVQPWHDADLVTALDRLREQVARDDKKIDVSQLLEEYDD